ncbi:hypothetical protein EYC84_010790 [Monilinia fructicola]|uniref:Uncharacterized protein n=1 Tax=Monilinia fructicola TaxID=38448 RepID=A0A5M9JCS1_MONFR|nr:hypothetical protein EYC84_010790 [Monilinia fructicola]
MSSGKRPASESFGSSQMVVKRQNIGNESTALATTNGSTGNGALIQAARTSGLQAPVMQLEGHSGEVFAAKFDPNGNYIASGSMDRSIRPCFSASADMHLASWDLETGTRIRRHVGHEEVINCMDISKRGEELLISGSDDGYIGIWDPRTKAAVDFIPTEFPVTAVALAEAGNELYSGGIDNDIKVWDMRRKAVFAHGTYDPLRQLKRHLRTFDGAPSGMEKNLIRASWDSTGKKIAAGAGDGTAVVWNNESGKILYKLPGHKGTVNCAELSPGKDPIILTAFFGSYITFGGIEVRRYTE